MLLGWTYLNSVGEQEANLHGYVTELNLKRASVSINGLRLAWQLLQGLLLLHIYELHLHLNGIELLTLTCLFCLTCKLVFLTATVFILVSAQTSLVILILVLPQRLRSTALGTQLKRWTRLIWLTGPQAVSEMSFPLF